MEWVANHCAALQQWFPALDGVNLMESLFSRTYHGRALIPGMPQRAGYAYGYFVCREALDRKCRRYSATDMVAAPWQKVLSLSAGRGP